jgi:hypothetical protein
MQDLTRGVQGSILTVALMLSACGGSASSPTLPSSTAPPSSVSPSSVTNWKVTQRFVSVTGPDNCWVRYQRGWLTGAVFPDLPMSVNRSGGSITLESGFFQVNYRGTYSGTEFSASGVNPLDGGGTPCQDGTSFQQMPGTSNLSGRFSADDQSLSATEVNSYRLTTGEPVTYTWDWQASRPN